MGEQANRGALIYRWKHRAENPISKSQCPHSKRVSNKVPPYLSLLCVWDQIEHRTAQEKDSPSRLHMLNNMRLRHFFTGTAVPRLLFVMVCILTDFPGDLPPASYSYEARTVTVNGIKKYDVTLKTKPEIKRKHWHWHSCVWKVVLTLEHIFCTQKVPQKSKHHIQMADGLTAGWWLSWVCLNLQRSDQVSFIVFHKDPNVNYDR